MSEAALAERVAKEMLSREGTGLAWNIEIEKTGPGYSRLSMTIQPGMLNGHGIAHGGMLFALADTAFAYACNSRNEASVSQSASIVFIDSVKSGERIVAEASETAHKGRNRVYSVTVTGADGRVVAVVQSLGRTLGGPVIDL
ncbi:hotdog fold thioesterase [Burkholderia sp. Bp9140]|nr:hotdog fold thioesterase [Burkholderia sp. Bp9140]